MNYSNFFFTGLLSLAWVTGFGAPSPVSPHGHWEGAITLAQTKLAIRVDLDRRTADKWTGSIDIPVQGLRGLKLGGVVVHNASVTFTLAGIPGDPQFTGTLSPEGKSINGKFSQGGRTFPFQLNRKPRPTQITGETPRKGVPGQGLAGYWQGSLRPLPILELRLVLEITNGPTHPLAGVMISVDQGGVHIPITVLMEKAGNVHLETRSVRGTFDGRLSADGSEITGEWKQSGNTLPLVFQRLAKAPEFRHAQEPVPPYPYEEEQVQFENPSAHIKLAGTLTVPRGAGPYPAVVLITGSGPQNRDEAIMGHRPFLVLADYLTRRGIAVLRYDDRGVGGSTGDFAKATDEDFVSDALAAVAWLKTRREIDPRRIGLVGHSEGGIIAPRAAVMRPKEVAFIVMLAGVGVPMKQLVLRQAHDVLRLMGADQEALTRNAALERNIFRLLEQKLPAAELEKEMRALFQEQMAHLTAQQRQALGYSDAMLEGRLRTLLSPWFRDLLAYDPRPTLRRVKCPVLAINGEKDIQVAARENLTAIRKALLSGGNTHVETKALPGLNHLFQTCRTGSISEYSRIQETFSPVALEVVGDWIVRVTDKK